MKYEVYQMVIGDDDILIANNLTLEEAKELKGDRRDYLIFPQHINGG